MGTQELTVRFHHQEYGDIVRIPVDSDWAGGQERNSTHAGLEFDGGHLIPGQVRALSSGEAELCGIVDGSALGIFTKHVYEEMGRTINIDFETDSTAAIGMCSRTGVGKTRRIPVRWLWIQEAVRDKIVRLRKVGIKNEADMGTKKPGRTDASALVAETATQTSPVQTAPRLDCSNWRKRRRGAGVR